jgi:hypothetical protein
MQKEKGTREMLVLCLIAVVLLAAPAAATQVPAAEPRVNRDARALAEFHEEVEEYLELQRKLARTLPPLPENATPAQIDGYQRALERLIQRARRDAEPGDVFEADVRPVIRRLLHSVFSGPDGKALRLAMMDENPGAVVRIRVNARYPDTIPLSTVPPAVLKILPALPDELEYRFIGTTLILFDTVAHIIVDYVTGAVPR